MWTIWQPFDGCVRDARVLESRQDKTARTFRTRLHTMERFRKRCVAVYGAKFSFRIHDERSRCNSTFIEYIHLNAISAHSADIVPSVDKSHFIYICRCSPNQIAIIFYDIADYYCSCEGFEDFDLFADTLLRQIKVKIQNNFFRLLISFMPEHNINFESEHDIIHHSYNAFHDVDV